MQIPGHLILGLEMRDFGSLKGLLVPKRMLLTPEI